MTDKCKTSDFSAELTAHHVRLLELRAPDYPRRANPIPAAAVFQELWEDLLKSELAQFGATFKFAKPNLLLLFLGISRQLILGDSDEGFEEYGLEFTYAGFFRIKGNPDADQLLQCEEILLPHIKKAVKAFMPGISCLDRIPIE
jgi:hypothetical protein